MVTFRNCGRQTPTAPLSQSSTRDLARQSQQRQERQGHRLHPRRKRLEAVGGNNLESLQMFCRIVGALSRYTCFVVLLGPPSRYTCFVVLLPPPPLGTRKGIQIPVPSWSIICLHLCHTFPWFVFRSSDNNNWIRCCICSSLPFFSFFQMVASVKRRGTRLGPWFRAVKGLPKDDADRQHFQKCSHVGCQRCFWAAHKAVLEMSSFVMPNMFIFGRKGLNGTGKARCSRHGACNWWHLISEGCLATEIPMVGGMSASGQQHAFWLPGVCGSGDELRFCEVCSMAFPNEGETLEHTQLCNAREKHASQGSRPKF